MNTSMLSSTTAADWDGPGQWWPVFPALWLLVVIGAIVTFAVIGRRRRWAAGAGAGKARLAERFAAGEIGEVEYEERLATLKRLGSR